MKKSLRNLIGGIAVSLAGIFGLASLSSCGPKLEYAGKINNTELMEQLGSAPPEQRQIEYYGQLDNVMVRSLLYEDTRQLFIVGPGGGRIEFLGERNKPKVDLVEIVSPDGRVVESYGVNGKNGFNIPSSYRTLYLNCVNSIKEEKGKR